MDRPICLGFAVLERSKLHMYETYYDEIQPYFGKEYLQYLYMDSVTKETPILIKDNEKIKILRIDEFVDEEDWYVDNKFVTSREYMEFANCNNFQIWTSEGLEKI